MKHSEHVENLGSQYGWTLEGELVREADTTRANIVREDGRPAMLYVFDDELSASRAAHAHSIEFGAQLFAVPERIESGPGWVLVEPIEGVNLAEHISSEITELPARQADAVVAGVARLLSKLHSIEFERYGDILPDAEGSSFLTFNGWAAHHLEAFAEAIRSEGFDDEVVGQLSEAIADLRHELAAYHPRSPAGLAHGRPHAEHIWIAPESFEVVGVTGLHHLASLPRELDIASFLWIVGVGRSDDLVRRFYQSYGAARTMDVQRRERFFRRLAAFLALSGVRGPSPLSPLELVELTGR